MRRIGVLLVLLGWPWLAWAGPVVIDGTDANDHGFCSASCTVNEDGWLYMQKVLQNLEGQLSGSYVKVVVNLGATNGAGSTDAFDAITSAFNLSTLPGLGWTQTNVDGDTDIASWLAALSTTNTGILYIPSAGLLSGDLTAAELVAVNNGATSINTFVSTQGGALFSQGETGTGAYGWLTTLLPLVTVTADCGASGVSRTITLTADGNTAFPGLLDSDLSTGPWHDEFTSTDFGGLKVLATSSWNGVCSPVAAGTVRNVIIGGGAGTQIVVGALGTHRCFP